jgi:hypothetical protein
MRTLARIVFAMASIAFAASDAWAQDPNAAPELAPAVAPVLEDAVEPIETLAARPEEELPAIENAAATVEGAAPDSSGDGEQKPEVSVEMAPLAPPPFVESAVETAARFSRPEADDPVRGQRSSDWVFLGILALAVVVIIARLTHTKQETVSIHDDRATRPSSGPKAPGPPIVRHT